MATNMAPHNLVETIAAARRLDHPGGRAGADALRAGAGPPTGGRVVGLEGIRDAYRTGRGSFKMRATTRIENITSRRKGIVVAELPYRVSTERLAEKLRDAVQASGCPASPTTRTSPTVTTVCAW